MDGGGGFRERRGHVGSVRQGRWRMLPIGCLNVMGGAPNTSLSYIQAMRHITNNFDNLCEDDKLVLDLVLNKGYQHFSILKNIIRMWTT